MNGCSRPDDRSGADFSFLAACPPLPKKDFVSIVFTVYKTIVVTIVGTIVFTIDKTIVDTIVGTIVFYNCLVYP